MAKQDAQDRKKRKTCSFCADHVESIDYKDAAKLKRYLTVQNTREWLLQLLKELEKLQLLVMYLINFECKIKKV